MKAEIRKWTPTKFIAVGLLVIILTGALLLTLPIASRSGKAMPFLDALFTATTSTCVTGLVLHDVYTTWTLFGQIVILLLIQTGGIGFMTLAVAALTLMKKKIGLSQRLTMQESVGAPQVGGIVRLTKFILLGTLLVETAGTVALSFVYCPLLGFFKGVYFSVFHAVSAFCNAGIDLMGCFEPGSSLVTLQSNVIVNVTIMALIVIGGLGFFVWKDVVQARFRWRKLALHSKIVLTTTVLLIVGGFLTILLLEYNGGAMEGMTPSEKILASLFQSVTPRTAGFNTVDLTALRGATQFFITGLMLIGGSPGSTAGGLKTTALAVLFLSILSVFKKRKSVEAFKHRVEDDALRHASCIMMVLLLLVFASTVAISAIDGIGVKEALFEVVSAIATVGLSLGVTAELSAASHIILILLMYIGRVGGITILVAFGSRRITSASQWPAGKITI